MKFPPLFNITKKGKTIEWRTWTDESCSYHQFGEVGGKMRNPIKRVAYEVNVGKSNYRTSQEQAILVCKRSWVSQLDKGYAPKDEEGIKMYSRIMAEKSIQHGNNHGLLTNDTLKPKNENELVCDHVETAVFPMLAHKYIDKKNKYVDFNKGVFIQPKLDGVRCIARLQRNIFSTDGYDIVLTSRNGKQFVYLSHIKENVKRLLLQRDYNNLILDGELYMSNNIDTIDRFNMISACCRTIRNSPHEKEADIEYHIFDLIDINKEYDQERRFAIIDNLKKNTHFACIKYVNTFESHNETDVQTYHDRFIHEGYEGVIVRATPCLYVQKYRSNYLLKYKQFEDKEFPIIGASTGEGDEEGCVIWTCQTENGIQFSCRPRGTFEYRKKLYKSYTTYLGAMLTVRYQELTSIGVPRFPVGIAIRNYE